MLFNKSQTNKSEYPKWIMKHIWVCLHLFMLFLSRTTNWISRSQPYWPVHDASLDPSWLNRNAKDEGDKTRLSKRGLEILSTISWLVHLESNIMIDLRSCMNPNISHGNPGLRKHPCLFGLGEVSLIQELLTCLGGPISGRSWELHSGDLPVT